jgi:hypothetical protein
LVYSIKTRGLEKAYEMWWKKEEVIRRYPDAREVVGIDAID